jgi:hypothetical protein
MYVDGIDEEREIGGEDYRVDPLTCGDLQEWMFSPAYCIEIAAAKYLVFRRRCCQIRAGKLQVINKQGKYWTQILPGGRSAQLSDQADR